MQPMTVIGHARKYIFMNNEINKNHIENAVIILFIMPFFNGVYNGYLEQNPLFFWILDITHYIIIPLCVTFYLFKRSNLKMINVGLQIPKNKKDWTDLIIHTLLVTICLYIFTSQLFIFFRQVYPSDKYPSVFEMGWMIPENIGMKYLTTVYYGITAGLVEEFYYRGLLVFLFFLYGMKKSLIVLLISCIFSLVHWEGGPSSIMSTFIFSLVITSYYVRFKMLWPLVIGHFLFDWIWFFQHAH